MGILSSRELIGASAFFEPDLDTFGEVWTTFLQLLKANGGHPQMGKTLTRMFLKAGFSDIHASASFDSYSTTGDIDVLHGVANGWFFSPETVAAATRNTGWHVTNSSMPGAGCSTRGRTPRGIRRHRLGRGDRTQAVASPVSGAVVRCHVPVGATTSLKAERNPVGLPFRPDDGRLVR